MKLKILFFIVIIVTLLIPLALAQEENDTFNQPPAPEDYNQPPEDEAPTGNTNAPYTSPTDNILPLSINKLPVDDYLKAKKGICIGDNCKTNWPALKCADYNQRPKGESGDSYCSSLNKTCSSVVFSGRGASYFAECSGIPESEHKTRCCWVE